MRLLRDVFPAEVYAPHRSETPWRRARVFVTDERVQVWTERGEGREREPVLTLDEPIVDGHPERTRGSLFHQLHIATDAGMVHVTPARGCGCGSVLKAIARPVQW